MRASQRQRGRVCYLWHLYFVVMGVWTPSMHPVPCVCQHASLLLNAYALTYSTCVNMRVCCSLRVNMRGCCFEDVDNTQGTVVCTQGRVVCTHANNCNNSCSCRDLSHATCNNCNNNCCETSHMQTCKQLQQLLCLHVRGLMHVRGLTCICCFEDVFLACQTCSLRVNMLFRGLKV